MNAPNFSLCMLVLSVLLSTPLLVSIVTPGDNRFRLFGVRLSAPTWKTIRERISPPLFIGLCITIFFAARGVRTEAFLFVASGIVGCQFAEFYGVDFDNFPVRKCASVVIPFIAIGSFLTSGMWLLIR